jgi:glycosyltransferase involved in cell wall biosynthesis
MRIGIYYQAQTDRKTGGDAVFQETIVDEIRKAGCRHEVYLFSPTAPAELPDDQKGIRFIKLDTASQGKLGEVSKVLNRARNYGAELLLDRGASNINPLEKAVREHRIDLLWFVSNWTEKVSIPYIATVWDLAHRLHPYFPEVSVTGWKWGARERHYRELLPRAAGVITGTSAGKEEITKYYQVPERLVHVVPFPTPRFALAPTAGEEVAETKELPEKYLFYPAQFWPHKNHVGLLLALKNLREQYGLDFHLVLTGSDKGNLEYVREKVEELGLADRVVFFGFVETNFLREIYQRAFALVYPTFFGPDNLPPLEAFALGCPVIASRVEGAEEQLGDAAILFDPKNPEEMAGRIRDLHDSPARREEMIRLGRERALRWTAADYVERVFSIIGDFEPVRRCWSSLEPYVHK